MSSLVDEQVPTITKDECSYYGRLNRTGFGLIRSYEGIPENLLINIVVSVVIKLNWRRKICWNWICFRFFCSFLFIYDVDFRIRKVWPMETSKLIVFIRWNYRIKIEFVRISALLYGQSSSAKRYVQNVGFL